MKKIPIIFAINNNYVKQLSTVIISILKNSYKSNSFEFNIMSGDLSQENQEKIKALSSFNKNSKFNFIDTSKIFKNTDLEQFMSVRDDYHYITVETYFRFFIPELFPQYKKVLYLDADILVLDNIQKMYEEDIEDYYAGVVQDTVLEVLIQNPDYRTKVNPRDNYLDYFKKKLKKKNTTYFNAGILLMNLEKIRKDNITKKLWDFTQEESPLEFQDQDVLNAVLEDNVKFIDYRWNTLKDLNWFVTQIEDKKKRKYLLKTYKNPSIFHYVGSNKPWIFNNENYNYSFISEWWKYYKLSPFYNSKTDEIIYKSIMHKKKIVDKEYLNVRVFDKTWINIRKYRQFALDMYIFGLKTRVKHTDYDYKTEVKKLSI